MAWGYPLTNLARYLQETGTTQTWLAEQVGTTTMMVCRWANGDSGMDEYAKQRVLAVLAQRNEVSLDGLLDDQRELHSRRH